jgi:ferredoxin--NADP+ reductase
MKILSKENYSPEIVKLIILAPDIASRAKAGQFVMIIPSEGAERIPLTIADWNREQGTISLIFQKVGYTTRLLAEMNPGDEISHLLGPLGKPTHSEGFKSVVCVGGGVGIAELYPVARAFKQSGSRVESIIGARNRQLLILEAQMREYSDELLIATDDGSYASKGLVTDILRRLLQAEENSTHTIFPDLVYAIGPVPMMKAVSELSLSYGIKTIVSLNPIMVDGTGMCGSCRCSVEGKTVFACVDGPEFDAAGVDFEELSKRLKTFREKESSL